MNLNPYQINTVQQGNIYVLYGSNTDLITIVSAKLSVLVQGYYRYEYLIKKDFNFKTATQELNQIGFFAPPRFITFEIASLVKSQETSFLNLLQALTKDDIVVIKINENLKKSPPKGAWFAYLEKNFLLNLIDCYKLSATDLRKAIFARVKELGYKITDDAVSYFGYVVENNLLQYNQYFDMLPLAFPDAKNTVLDQNNIKEYIEQSSIYTPFNLLDILFEKGQTERAIRILHSLQENGTVILVLIRLLQKELQLLLELYETNNTDEIFTARRVWNSRKQQYLKFLKSKSKKTLLSCITMLYKLELLAKGVEHDENPWLVVEKLIIKLAV